GCRELRVVSNEKPMEARLVAADTEDDLAILRLAEPVATSAPLRGDIPVKPGEAVVVVGFPLQGLLSSQASVTAGIVSRLAGPPEDWDQMAKNAAVAAGDNRQPPLPPSRRRTGRGGPHTT